MNDTISRQAALDALGEAPEVWTDSPEEFAALNQWEMDVTAIKAVSSVQPKTGQDCTDFIRWLIDEVMDEENWQLNAVDDGEIICRKLKKLGLLDVVDGYYVETQKTGEWEIYVLSPFDGEGCRCSECGTEGAPYWDYCPNCGADMRGEEE